MKKAQKEANTDASVVVSTAVSERACVCVCVSTADLPNPWACTEKTEQLSFCNVYITLNMFVKLQKKKKCIYRIEGNTLLTHQGKK